jgi:putative hydrolase of the HAD superfamily
VSSLISDRIRAVVFDAVGTLIHPDPSAADVYANAGRIFGSKLSNAEIAQRFRAAFRRQEEIDFAAGLRTNEARESERWRAIVRDVLNDVKDPGACFRHLYEHFGQPSAWRLEPDAVATVSALETQGYRVGIASNFDHRLRGVLAPSELSRLPLVISAEVGWRKPAGAFFAAMCPEVGSEVSSVLYVGDDMSNDYEGAIAAGCEAVLFDPGRRVPTNVPTVQRLWTILGRALTGM